MNWWNRSFLPLLKREDERLFLLIMDLPVAAPTCASMGCLKKTKYGRKEGRALRYSPSLYGSLGESPKGSPRFSTAMTGAEEYSSMHLGTHVLDRWIELF